MPGLMSLQPPKQIRAMLRLALISSPTKVKHQKPIMAKKCEGLKNHPAFSRIKKRAVKSATSRLTTAPATISSILKEKSRSTQKTKQTIKVAATAGYFVFCKVKLPFH